MRPGLLPLLCWLPACLDSEAQSTATVGLTVTVVGCVLEDGACVVSPAGADATCEPEGDGCRLVVPDTLPAEPLVPPTEPAGEGPS